MLILFFRKLYLGRWHLNLFIFGHPESLLLCVGFLQLQQVETTPSCGVQASYHGGFSCYRAPALGTQASVVVACRLTNGSS